MSILALTLLPSAVSNSESEDSLFMSILALTLLPSAAWSGFVLARLWAWFVVPLGVPGITVWHAAGLFVITSWMAGAYTSANSDRSGSMSLALMAIVPLFALAAGGIYHSLMT